MDFFKGTKMGNTLFTVGQIADQLNQPPARIAYMISKFRIKPTQRVGILRLFSQEQVKGIKQSLSKMNKRRS